MCTASSHVAPRSPPGQKKGGAAALKFEAEATAHLQRTNVPVTNDSPKFGGDDAATQLLAVLSPSGFVDSTEVRHALAHFDNNICLLLKSGTLHRHKGPCHHVIRATARLAQLIDSMCFAEVPLHHPLDAPAQQQQQQQHSAKGEDWRFSVYTCCPAGPDGASRPGAARHQLLRRGRRAGGRHGRRRGPQRQPLHSGGCSGELGP